MQKIYLMCLLRFVIKLSFVLLFFASCKGEVDTLGLPNPQNNQFSALATISATTTNPSTGTVYINSVTAIAKPNGTGSVRVTLSKIINGELHEIYVYYNPSNSAVTHISYSWITNGTLNNAFSSSPTGVTVDLSSNKVRMNNALLSSGLPTSATLDGQFYFINL